MDLPVIVETFGSSGGKKDTSRESFKSYLFNTKFNRIALILIFSFVTVEFCVFKYFYPFAGFINGDSYQYIASAFYNLRVDVYPIGYSKFIRLFSVFSYNDTSLVAFQYSLFIVSITLLLFSLFYLYECSKWARILLIALIVPNPVFLYLANYISSDTLFLALSISWFTTLIWIINKPGWKIIMAHSIIICLAFMVRYNALYYPFISLLALFINKEALKVKLVGTLVTIVLLGIFIVYTSGQYKRITGDRQFSPFSGWQLANNAMYAYRYIDSSKRITLSKKFKELDQDVRNYFDSTRDLKKYPYEAMKASTVYMWDERSPLLIYMHRHFAKDTTQGELKSWSKIAPFYNAYGKEIIKTYPNAFLEYYIWPNFLKYYVPPVEFLEYYSTNVDTVPPLAKQWFWYSGNKLKFRTKTMKVDILTYYPMISGAFNFMFVAVCGFFLFFNRISLSNRLFQIWCVVAVFWICNLLFSVFASPVALRFQLFPNLICTVSCFFFMDQMIKLVLQEESAKRQITEVKVASVVI